MTKHKSRIGCFVIDCQSDELANATNFWANAQGYKAHTRAGSNYIMLESESDQPKLLLQAVDHPARIHLDIETDDKDAEQSRLEALGAKVVGPCKNWIVMQAPTGHRFCIVDPQRNDFDDNATSWNNS